MDRLKEVESRMFEDNVHQSLIDYISTSVSGFDKEIEIAIVIYIKLAQLFWYDAKFLVNNDYDVVSNLSDISTENNEVICIHWAIIYSKILTMYGIENKVIEGDKHLSVKIYVGGYVIYADATKYGVEHKDYLLSDLTNAKIGIKICGFETLSPTYNNELSEVIDNVYSKLNMKVSSYKKMDNVVDKFRLLTLKRLKKKEQNNLMIIDKAEIDKRISLINRFYYVQKSLHEVEKLQLFSKYYKSIFEGFEFDKCRCFTMCSENEVFCGLLKLIVTVDDLNNIYYFLETEYGFAEYQKEELIEYLIRNGVYFKYDTSGILGFEDTEVKRLLK